MTRILVIDNYDSFVYTLDGYLQQLGAETEVVRNDAIPEAELGERMAQYDAVLVSPGPGAPADAGASIPAVRIALRTGQPLLGVCLGHQAIAEAFGATVTHAEELMHGKTSRVEHDDSGFWQGVPANFRATRYHSLAVVDGTVPEDLVITARTAEGGVIMARTAEGGVIMALRHATAPIVGVQFHPESVLTEGGYRMLGNWLEAAGLTGAAARAADLHPLVSLG